VQMLLEQCLRDAERGYGGRELDVTAEALEHLAEIAGGDARTALNALELAVESTSPDEEGVRYITLEVAEESIQQRALQYDKAGDEHYDTVSAFIKSVRGSAPDAALYYLAKMIMAGEDPRFIFRRLLVLAAEDVGLAEPMAIAVVAGCARAFEWVGMPEFEQEDAAMKMLRVYFAAQEDVDIFAELIGQPVTEKMTFIWYPKQERENLKLYQCEDES